MRLDPQKFQKKLEMANRVGTDYTPGQYRILDYIFTETPTRLVNFDSFTVEEMKRVIEAAYDYQCRDGYEDEDICLDENWGNVVHEYLRSTEVQYSLQHSKQKIFPMEDGFL